MKLNVGNVDKVDNVDKEAGTATPYGPVIGSVG